MSLSPKAGCRIGRSFQEVLSRSISISSGNWPYFLYLVLALCLQPLLASICIGALPPPVSILEIPLAYYGPKDTSYLAGEAQEGLSRRLEARGNKVFLAKSGLPVSMEEIIKAGRARHAQFAFYGSISSIGGQLSLDLRVIDLEKTVATSASLFASGDRRDLGLLLDRAGDKMLRLLDAPYLVADVGVVGNRRVDTDAILETATSRVGDLFDPKTVDSDIKAIYKMGFFDDVQVDVSESPLGRKVTFIVKEKPAIRHIKFIGNKKIKKDKIHDAIDIKPYTIVKEEILHENAEKIKALYEGKGYMDTTVMPIVKRISDKAADVTFKITEGKKVHIKSIKFQGNHVFSDKELKKLMETTEKMPIWTPSLKNIMSFFKGDTAVLKWDALDRDLGRIGAYYHNHGYVNVKVGQPTVRRRGPWLYITIPIKEGSRYGVGKVDIKQDFFKDKEKLLAMLKITKEPIFNQEVLRHDIMKLADLYADQGFAYADITPMVQRDPEKKLVNITLEVNRGPKVRFRRIEIVGNTRTRDKVIRRELRVKELEPFSASGFRKSSQRLKRLGYFKDVNLSPTHTGNKKYMDLKVKVKEQPTGSFSIGGGYSSVEKLMLMGEISQRNFLGKGETLSFKGILGAQTNRYSLSFVEPYFRDTRLSLGVDLYKWQQEYDDYTKRSNGGAIRFAYPLSDNLGAFIRLRMDNTKLSNISSYASRYIRDSLDIHVTRSISSGLTYDTRDDYYNPTRGWDNSASIEYAGGPLGGDSAYVKLRGVASYYHRIWKEFIGHVRGGLGYVGEGKGGKLPIYEKFFLGGADSVRGFKYGRISPTDSKGERIGGDYMGYMQIETIFPLVKSMGLRGLCFLDMGNVWDKKSGYDITDLRKSIGVGVKWLSPMGP
ncbi:MAG: outer membrane protein assembly factor BamA, partial [Nitrospiraceae bacterium]|nr:outer membrane protein assembly factor BamA [Nitrospiraceae bacterium]